MVTVFSINSDIETGDTLMAKVQTNPDQTPGLFSAMVQDFLNYIVTTKGQSEKTKKAYSSTKGNAPGRRIKQSN